MKNLPKIQAFGELSMTPFGPVGIFATNEGIARVTLGTKGVQCAKVEPCIENLDAFLIISKALTELDQYLSGKKRSGFDLPIDWSFVSDFQKKVLKLTLAIPFGEVRTYGQIAMELGSMGYARAVGSALAGNPYLLIIPCHRVIGKDRQMHGFSAPGGKQTKLRLLEHEGFKSN